MEQDQPSGPPRGFAIDLHVHTTAGSADSNLRALVLRERALALGLGGVAVTEHFRVWTEYEAADLMRGSPLLVYRGMEWNTEAGHILVLGVERHRPELRRVADLRRYVLDHGGLMIAAHPFRHAFDAVPALWKAYKDDDRSLDAAIQHPALAHVDAIEVLNSACIDRENELAAAVAARLGLPTTGGSDAHYAEDVGRTYTLFDAPVPDEAALIAAIRAGRGRPARG